MNKEFNFEKLTVNDNIDINIYEEAINFALKADDIKNIAISGAYGAGKSSVLASYKKKHTDKKFIHISLAHFKNDQEDEDKDKYTNTIIEGKILNQLIHQLDPKKIPQTNFKVKQNSPKRNIVFTTIGVVLFFISMLFVIFHSEWISFVDTLPGLVQWFLNFTKSSVAVLVAGFVIAVLIAWLVFSLITLQKNKRLFKRFSFQGSEIEIFEDKDESYFDKYLNEVLYLFENADVDAIVFEDMDRFEMKHIFERLREINDLVNIQLKKKGKTLRFFYLLRDDVFTSKDRTKFFDYIIPIVPVVDGTNSYDQFIVHLQKNDIFTKLDQKFLQGLSLYVDDMRLLKNICNELLIYYNRVNTIELDYNKMLALITYKNLFPRDFSDLQLGKGFVYSLISNKENYIKNESEKISEQIKYIEDEINVCEEEHLDSIEELDIIKDHRCSKATRAPYYEHAAKMAEYRKWEHDIYPKRKQTIEDVHSNKIGILRKQLDECYANLAKLSTVMLRDIITRENVDDIFKITVINEVGEKEIFTEIKASEYFSVLKYLIRNGYIDETYSDYMTYFYENSVSRIDKIFLRSVVDKKAKEFNYEIKDPGLVVSRLDVSDFKEIETLNFSILKYLLEEKPDSQQLVNLIQQLSDNCNVSFIQQFLLYLPKWDRYVEKINSLWVSLFKELLDSNICDPQMIHAYSVFSLCNTSLDVLSKMNIDQCLTRYISESPEYLNIQFPDISKLIEAFKYLNIRFQTINYSISDSNLFRAVYDNHLYELNFSNIKLMFLVMERIRSEEDIKHRNYTLLLERKDTPLYRYVSDNIEEYVIEILNNCEGEINDSEVAVLKILNHTDVSNNTKKQYLESLVTIIDSIKSIDDEELWDWCIDCNVIKPSENNIVIYFSCKKSFTSMLIKYINSFSNEINMQQVQFEDDSDASEIFSACVQCCDLENDKYKQFLCSMNRVYRKGFSVKSITDEKMEILIGESIIKMTEESLEDIRANYPGVCDYFIEKNIDAYVENINENNFSFDELLKILEWKTDDENKISLIAFTQDPISIIGKPYSDDVKIYILEHNMEMSDLEHLRKYYHLQSNVIKQFILSNALENIDEIIDCAGDISYGLLEEIFASTEVKAKDKLLLLTDALLQMSKEQCEQAFYSIGREDFASIFEPRKKPKFVVCEENKNVLINIKRKGWIYEYYVDPNDAGYYRIRRTKPSKLKHD